MNASSNSPPGEDGEAHAELLREQARLKERLAALENSPQLEEYFRQVSELRAQIETFDQRLATWNAADQRPEPAEEAPAPPAPQPPPLPVLPIDPPAPKGILIPSVSDTAPEPEPGLTPEPVPALAKTAAPAKPAAPKKDAAGLEIELGRYWLSRIGIVMLLTGFVFLATYLGRKMFAEDISPLVRTGVLYLTSFALLGTGLWLERWRESLRNYGQVVAAGGMAAVFYTTFAAHYIDKLKIIPNPVVAGVLLLLWTGAMVYYADRKKSQTLAILGILLAYYACLITEATTFSLWSALILGGAALFFLVRNRWTVIGFMSLAGTYVAYAYWRFFAPLTGAIDGADFDGRDFWPASIFLICYWVMFSAAMLMSSGKAFSLRQRTTFAGINNAAFLALFALGMLPHREHQVWLFAFIMGLIFLGIWVYLSERLPWGTALKGDADAQTFANMFLVKGLAFATLGLAMKLSGPSLTLTLAAESAALLVIGSMMNHRLLTGAAFVAAALSVIETFLAESGTSLVVFGPYASSGDGIPLAAAIPQALFFFGAAWWLSWRQRGALVMSPGKAEPLFDPAASFFVIGGLLTFLVGALDDVSAPWRAFTLAAVAAAFAVAGSERFLRLRELSWFTQSFTVIAGGMLFYRLLDGRSSMVPDFGVLAILLGLEFWSRRDTFPPKLIETGFPKGFSGLLAIAFTLGTAVWLNVELNLEKEWLYVGGLLALAQFAYAVSVRSPLLAALSPLYHVVALVPLAFSRCSSGAALWPLGFLIVHIVIIEQAGRVPLLKERLTPSRERLATWGLLGLDALAITALSIWVGRFVETPWQAAVIFAAAAVVLALGVRRAVDHRIIAAFSLLLVGIPFLAQQLSKLPENSGPLYVAALILLGLQQIHRHLPRPVLDTSNSIGMLPASALNTDRKKIYTVLQWLTILLGTVLLWVLVSSDVREVAEGFYLTVSWAILALVLFAVGLALKERPYRLVSLALLGASLIRVLIIDVWKLEPVPRMLSFIAIGFVLLALGFVYNRFQESLRRYF